MAERISDVYEFNLKGNYQRELRSLQDALKAARAGFGDLAEEVQSNGASFASTLKEVAALKKAFREQGDSAKEVIPVQERLASDALTLANAYNDLVREQNRLTQSRQKELLILQRETAEVEPKIIQMRAEAAALRKLNKELEKVSTAREFERLANEAGFKVSADRTRLFDAEAEAMQRAAKAAQSLAVSEALRSKGLDAAGKPLAQPTRLADGKLSASGEQKAQVAAQARLDSIAIKERIKAILEENGVVVDKKKKTDVARASLKVLNEEGEKSNGVFNRVSFTFRRLIGIMAAFTIARQVAGAFTTMVTEAITFNSAIEQSRVGIAGLVAAAAQVRDPISGKLLSVDNQILRAQDIAIDQMKKLRVDALQTAASYDELARAFQTAVAPGLQNNLTLDQIRKVTVQISQAATGLGVAQDTLAEEIRSLFEGTISARNTRIATALGISNADIQRAKQAGQLFEFISQRFAAISKTGKLLMDTFVGQLSNATDAFKQLLAETSRPLFEQLKASLADIQKAIFTTVNDAVIFKPDALQAFKGLFDGLAAGVEGIRAAFQGVDVQGFADTLGAVGKGLGLVATVIATALRTAFNIAAPLISVLNLVLRIFNRIATSVLLTDGGFLSVLGRVVVTAGKILIIKLAIDKTLVGVRALRAAWAATTTIIAAQNAAIGVFSVRLSGISKILLLLRARLYSTFLPLLGAAAALVAIDFLLSKITGVSILDSIGSALEFLGDSVDNLFGGLKGQAETAFTPLQDSLALVIADTRKLKSELQDIGVETKISLASAAADYVTTIRSLGASTQAAQQINIMSEAQRDFGKQTLQANQQLRAQTQTLLKLQQRNEELSATPGIFDELTTKGAEISRLQSKLNSLSKELIKLSGVPFLDIAGSGTKEQIDSIRRQVAATQAQLSVAKGGGSKQLLELQRVSAEIAGILEVQKDAYAQIAATQREVLNLATLQLNIELARNNFELQNANQQIAPDLQAARASAAAAEQLDAIKADQLVKDAAITAEGVRYERAIRTIVRDQALNLEQIDKQYSTILNVVGATEEQKANSKLAVQQLTEQNSLLDEKLAGEAKVTNAKLKQLFLEKELARLRKEGSGLQGVGFGLQQFAGANNSTFNIGEQFGQDLANGVTTFVGQSLAQSVAAAFDPTRNFDLAEAAANLAITLAADLATKLAARLLSEGLQGLGIDVLDTATQTANATAAGAAFSAEALGSLTPAGGAAGAAFATAATTPLTAAGTTAGAAFGAAAASAINTAAGSAAATITAAGSVSAFARGGPAGGGPRMQMPRGFAGGGSSRRPRPLGIDGRDTIPAYLRAGEWVIRPESVRLYGDRFFQALNRGQLNPDALRGVAGGLPRSPVVKVAKKGFATGGPVAASAGRQGSAPVQVVQFYDEQAMDRALSAGPGSMVRFARQRRGAYRVALGLDEAT